VLEGRYRPALLFFVLAGVSDALDGLLARLLNQRTTLGEHLDPLADKLLLSTLFLTLSFVHQIPWRCTVLVFSRDLSILAVSAVLYATTTLRNFRPSIFGKVNTMTQILAVIFVLLANISPWRWIPIGRECFLWMTMAFTILSGVHYIYLTGDRLRAADSKGAAQVAAKK
jgi:cardiolipin synthase